ncbi:hypothetical protein OsJ_31606 [Oryza sativa Japonica Group]|uniref:Uncharacterized protein n=1 Tax=Oryza sativa subsp. japonica TaxID=39947 RepID=B9G5U6_ORYSJ|nr:hypothetical protein OsJ_31606 [Oryza sativa Japonica Group]
MVMPRLQELKEIFDVARGKVNPVILDLEESLLAKGNMTLEEEVTIRVSKMTASVFKVFATAAFGASSYYALGLASPTDELPPQSNLETPRKEGEELHEGRGCRPATRKTAHRRQLPLHCHLAAGGAAAPDRRHPPAPPKSGRRASPGHRDGIPAARPPHRAATEAWTTHRAMGWRRAARPSE